MILFMTARLSPGRRMLQMETMQEFQYMRFQSLDLALCSRSLLVMSWWKKKDMNDKDKHRSIQGVGTDSSDGEDNDDFAPIPLITINRNEVTGERLFAPVE